MAKEPLTTRPMWEIHKPRDPNVGRDVRQPDSYWTGCQSKDHGLCKPHVYYRQGLRQNRVAQRQPHCLFGPRAIKFRRDAKSHAGKMERKMAYARVAPAHHCLRGLKWLAAPSYEFCGCVRMTRRNAVIWCVDCCGAICL